MQDSERLRGHRSSQAPDRKDILLDHRCACVVEDDDIEKGPVRRSTNLVEQKFLCSMMEDETLLEDGWSGNLSIEHTAPLYWR